MLVNNPAFASVEIKVEKTIDAKQEFVEETFSDINNFSSMFGNYVKEVNKINEKKANVKMNIEGCSIDTTFEYEILGNKHVIDYVDGTLKDSKTIMTLSKTWSFDGSDPNGGTNVELVMYIKDVPCIPDFMAPTGTLKDEVDKGIYHIGMLAKQLQEEKQLEQQEEEVGQEIDNSGKEETTESDTENIDLKGPPLIDTDNDGIADEDDICDSYKETYNGYLDSDGCPDQKPTKKQIPATFVDTSLDPHHYIDRYNNEPNYREWFDENYPQYNSIYEAVGLVTNDVTKTKPVQDGVDQKEVVPKPGKDDFDNDGIPDEEDTCWKQAEVYNSYIDWDGCPDTESGQIKVVLDDDRDGVMNHLDQCPNMKEVQNNFRDNDGCPDAILKTPEDYEPKPYQTAEATKPIPGWVKNNAKWYSVGSITDRDFAQSITFMIKEDLIQIDHEEANSKSSFSVGTIPDWVKRPAGSWADGDISNTEFVRTIQFLVDSDIIKVY